MSDIARWYGVSSGNGNDGVSQMFADYYVFTNEPYRLAELAALTTFKPGEGQTWAKENMRIDGESDYTIYVTFLESPETQDARREAEAAYENYEGDDTGPAWLCFEIFPCDVEHQRKGCKAYESLDEAFGADIALTPSE